MRLQSLVLGLAVLIGCSPDARGPAVQSPAASRPGAPDRNRIVVSGDLPRTGSLGIEDLAALGAVDFTWEHTGENRGTETRAMHGVPIEAVLRRFGWDIGPGGKEAGPADRRSGWRCAILAKAADGFRTTFSSAEVTADNGPSTVYVAWQENGAPLDPSVGPIRLVVPTDKKGSRSVRQLVELLVVDLGK